MVVLEAEPVVAPDYGGAPRGAAGVDSWPAFFGFAAFFTAGFGDWGGGLAGVGGLIGGRGGGRRTQPAGGGGGGGEWPEGGGCGSWSWLAEYFEGRGGWAGFTEEGADLVRGERGACGGEGEPREAEPDAGE